MNFVDYCTQAGIKQAKEPTPAPSLPAPHHRGSGVLRYRVPELTPDGTCSITEKLAAEPYDLRTILQLKTRAQEQRAIQQIEYIYESIAGLQEVLHADWVGVYQRANQADGSSLLVKLAYEGKPSRAEFPLTEEFAAISNNATVGRTGKAVIIQDVAAHSGPYYTCDSLVQSELCLPIYGGGGKHVIGIIDAESFAKNHFDGQKIAAAAQWCCTLSSLLPIRIQGYETKGSDARHVAQQNQ